MLTKNGAVREYSETLPDGRIITYTLEVTEEELEEEEDIEIAVKRMVGTFSTLHAGVVDTLTRVQEGQDTQVRKRFSRTVSREDGVSREVLNMQESEQRQEESEQVNRGLDGGARTYTGENGILITEL